MNDSWVSESDGENCWFRASQRLMQTKNVNPP